MWPCSECSAQEKNKTIFHFQNYTLILQTVGSCTIYAYALRYVNFYSKKIWTNLWRVVHDDMTEGRIILTKDTKVKQA